MRTVIVTHNLSKLRAKAIYHDTVTGQKLAAFARKLARAEAMHRANHLIPSHLAPADYARLI